MTGIGEAFEPRVKIARRVVVEAEDLFDQLTESDPITAGISEALGAMAAESGASPECRGASPLDSFGMGGETGVEAELFDGLDVDVLDDLHLELFGEPLDLDLGLSVASPDLDGDFGVEAEEVDELVLEGASPDEEGTPEAASASTGMSVDEAIAHCHISGMGYVTCDVAPWSSAGTLGRITTWPACKKEEERGIGCSCQLHSKCTSPAKDVAATSRQALLRWLLSGVIPPKGASTDFKRALGDRHRAAFSGIMASVGSSSST